MTKILIIILISTSLNAQKFMSNDKGSMVESMVKFDTLVETKSNNINTVIFVKIDSNFIDSLGLLDYLGLTNKTAFEYFILYNGTDDTLKLHLLNKRIVAEEISEFSRNNFKPICLFSYPTCGTGIIYKDLIITKNKLVLMHNASLNPNGEKIKNRKTILKLQNNKTKTLLSLPYYKEIDYYQFFIDSKFLNGNIIGSVKIAFH